MHLLVTSQAVPDRYNGCAVALRPCRVLHAVLRIPCSLALLWVTPDKCALAEGREALRLAPVHRGRPHRVLHAVLCCPSTFSISYKGMRCCITLAYCTFS